jgi:hypothetical protein
LETDNLVFERRVPNPREDRLSGQLCYFELNRPLSLLLHNDGARRDSITVRDIPHT